MHKRLESNRELIKILADLVEKNPELRFNQILVSSGFIKDIISVNPSYGIFWKNEYYLESKKLLERVKNESLQKET